MTGAPNIGARAISSTTTQPRFRYLALNIGRYGTGPKYSKTLHREGEPTISHNDHPLPQPYHPTLQNTKAYLIFCIDKRSLCYQQLSSDYMSITTGPM